MGNLSHMCETISMFGMTSLVLTCWNLLTPEEVTCLSALIPRLLALCVLIVVSFLGLLCEFGGVASARLIVSSRVVKMTAYSSCDDESWSEDLMCSGKTSSSCMLML